MYGCRLPRASVWWSTACSGTADAAATATGGVGGGGDGGIGDGGGAGSGGLAQVLQEVLWQAPLQMLAFWVGSCCGLAVAGPRADLHVIQLPLAGAAVGRRLHLARHRPRSARYAAAIRYAAIIPRGPFIRMQSSNPGDPKDEPALAMPPDDINFRTLRSSGLWFHDFTRFLPMLASTRQRQTVLARPGRTGKTLLLGTFALYLDALTTRDEFFTLFGDTDACRSLEPGELPPGALSYKVLSCNFTVQTHAGVAATVLELNARVIRALEVFVKRYNIQLPQTLLQQALVGKIPLHYALDTVMEAASSDGGRVYILVDKYDRAANKLKMEDPTAYRALVSSSGARAASSPISGIYEMLKNLAYEYPNLRTFSIGITPVAMADATGANSVADLSRSELFADVLGFPSHAVESALWRVPGLSVQQRSVVLERMRRFYHGYRHLGGDETLYHPKMVVNCLNRMVRDKQYCVDLANPTTSVLDQLALLKDVDVDTSHAALSMVLSQQHLSAALEEDTWFVSGGVDDAMLQRRQVVVRLAPFLQKLRFADLLSEEGSEVLSTGTAIERVRVFLYFQGLLTVAGMRKVRGDTEGVLWLPNLALIDSYLARCVPSLKESLSALITSVLHPSAEALRRGVQHVVGHPDGPLAHLQHFNESSFQAGLTACLRLAVDVVGVSANVRAEPVLDHRVQAADDEGRTPDQLRPQKEERTLGDREKPKVQQSKKRKKRFDARKAKRGDILIFVNNVPTALLELKLIHKSNVTSVPGYTGAQVSAFLERPIHGHKTSGQVVVITDSLFMQGVLKSKMKVQLDGCGPGVVAAADAPWRIQDMQQGATAQALKNYRLLCSRRGREEQRMYDGVRVFTVLLLGYHVIVREVERVL